MLCSLASRNAGTAHRQHAYEPQNTGQSPRSGVFSCLKYSHQQGLSGGYIFQNCTYLSADVRKVENPIVTPSTGSFPGKYAPKTRTQIEKPYAEPRSALGRVLIAPRRGGGGVMTPDFPGVILELRGTSWNDSAVFLGHVPDPSFNVKYTEN